MSSHALLRSAQRAHAYVKLSAAFLLTGALWNAQAAFQVVETFNSLNTGALNGQNGWVALVTNTTTPSTTVTVAVDPEVPVNKVLSNTAADDAYKLLATPIANASGGTMFYRVRVNSLTNDVSFGLSDANPPVLGDFNTFAIQNNVTGSAGGFGSRDGSGSNGVSTSGPGGFGNRTPLFNLVSGAWYNIWLVADTTADTYRLYVQRDGDAAYSTQTEIVSPDGAWNFRKAVSTNPLYAFAMLSNSANTRLMIDDIYVDTSAVPNLINPVLATPSDTDGDGLNDTWETFYFGNLTAQNGSGDPDGDGANNEAEETALSDPTVALSTPLDTDADGLRDDWEVTNFTNKTAQNGSGDPDGDGATNLQEFTANTDPNSFSSFPDSDGDGLNDAWETRFFLGLTAQNGGGDADGDGASNSAEYAAGSDPTNVNWTPTKAALKNRWSFNGDLTDSVGGSNATIVDPDSNATVGGVVTQNADSVTLTGGVSTTSAAVKLGANLIGGKTTPVTLEFWATQNAVQNWGRVFDFGSATNEYFFMSWTRTTNSAQDQVEWIDGTVAYNKPDTNGGFALGTKYHIVLTLVPAAYTNGAITAGTRVTWYIAPATNTTTPPAKGTFDTPYTLAALNDLNNWIGRSMWTNDNVANATYDEVRIWNGALTNDELTTYQLAGPNGFAFTDTDGDGLSDPWEITYFGNLSQTGSADPDGDTHNNFAEYNAGSNPTVATSVPNDIDGDGLPDSWELTNFNNLNQTPAGDPDGDRATNLQEYLAGSVPNSASSFPDTDSDGLNDAWEQFYFSSLQYDSYADPDDDSYDNYSEQNTFFTNPNDYMSSPDSDADGLPDGWEIHYFKLSGETGLLNYNTIFPRQSGTDDPDADGFNNAFELAFLTNPNLATSVPGDIDGNGTNDGPVLKFGGDLINTTSFDAGLNWNDAAAPVAGKTYIVSINGLRTPTADGTYTFAGDKLVLTTAGTNVGTLIWKTNSPVTFPILQMDGGMINQAAGTAAIQINGSVLVTKTSTLWANNGDILVNAPISGTGDLVLTGGRLVTFAGVNTRTGSLSVTNTAGFTLASTGRMTFKPGAVGVSNAIGGTGPVVFNGGFIIDASTASATLGDAWNLVTTTGAKTYGATFSVVGYASDGAAAGVRKWTSLGTAPFYQFDEATGALTVVNNPDADNDGLVDTWEISNFGDLSRNGSGDFDNDGSTDAQEFAAGTNPTLDTSWPDTDADGVKDSFELATFGNLTTATATDKDGDTLLDTWEVTYFGSIATQNGTVDSDGDTHSNATEQTARSNPALAASVPGDINADGVADGHLMRVADGVDTTSFNAGLNWIDTLAPVAGENYLVDLASLRTPTDAANYAFAGANLVLFTNGNLLVKGTGVLTFPNLVLDGGRLHNGINSNTVGTIEGAISVTRASEIYAQNNGFIFNAVISGSANLNITGAGLVTFAAANTWKGALSVLNTSGFALASTGSFNFAPGANGITNAITGTGQVTLNGTFNINTSAASTASGSSWNLVATTGAKTYGATFTVTGFTPDSGTVGARKWTSGIYTFDEATGALSVAGASVSALQAWRLEKFGSTDNAGNAADTFDFDNDGRANLLEYALGTDPTVANSGAVATVANTGGVLTLTFNHIGDATLTYVIEASANLTTWETAQSYIGFTTAGATTYTDGTTLGAGVRRFLRLKVIAP